MREDMPKVLVERPRPSSRWNKPKLYRRLKKFATAAEDAPVGESMTRRYVRTFGSRHFNENLAPLRRFLERAVGRPWDKVYSEICERVDRSNTVQKHVLTHLWDDVATGVHEFAGELWANRRGYIHPLSEGRARFYVDPKGFLRRNERRGNAAWKKSEAEARNQRRAALGFVAGSKGGRNLSLVIVGDGSAQWFEVSYAKIPDSDGLRAKLFDVLFRRPVLSIGWEELQLAYGSHTRYAESKRPLASTEIKRLGLPAVSAFIAAPPCR